MCPACLTTAAIALLGATTTGGIAAVWVKKVVRPSVTLNPLSSNATVNEKEHHHE